MALTLEELAAELQSKLSTTSEKLTDLDSDTLLERHTNLVAERVAMPDTDDPQKRAAVTNKVKRIETVLRERGVEFTPLPQANRPMSLEDMTEQQLLEEFQRIQSEYNDATAGQKSSMTVRLKAMKKEVAKRLGQSEEIPEATDTVQPDTEAEGPTDEELETVEATTATATEEKPAGNRRRR